jgi:hypothetical protein
LLAEYLIALARDETLRASVGAAAREFVAEQHSLERSVEGYLATLGEVLGRPLALPEGGGLAAAISTMVGGVRPSAAAVTLRRLARVPGAALRALRNPVLSSDVSVSEQGESPLAENVATALTELRLAGHEGLERSVARDLVALGLGADGDGSKFKVGWQECSAVSLEPRTGD